MKSTLTHTTEKPALAETRTHNAETLARFAVALEYAERYARLSAYLVSIGWNEKEFATAIAKGAELEAARGCNAHIIHANEALEGGAK